MTSPGDVAASAIRIPMPNRFAQLAALAASALCLGDMAMAQQVPNAGSILRQLEPETPSLPALKTQPGPKPPSAAVPSGPALHVRGFRIEGNQLIATARIQRLLAGYVGRDLSPADLRQATDSIARLYNHEGWLARVLVPPSKSKPELWWCR